MTAKPRGSSPAARIRDITIGVVGGAALFIVLCIVASNLRSTPPTNAQIPWLGAALVLGALAVTIGWVLPRVGLAGAVTVAVIGVLVLLNPEWAVGGSLGLSALPLIQTGPHSGLLWACVGTIAALSVVRLKRR